MLPPSASWMLLHEGRQSARLLSGQERAAASAKRSAALDGISEHTLLVRECICPTI